MQKDIFLQVISTCVCVYGQTGIVQIGVCFFHSFKTKFSR